MKQVIALAVSAVIVTVGAVAVAGTTAPGTTGANAPATSAPPATGEALPEAPADTMADAAADGPFLLYMAPDGAAANTGLTPSSPLPTLADVQTRLRKYDPQTDVEVHIAPGTYAAPETRWWTYIDGHSISFMPSGYSPGEPAPKRPIFQGTGSDEYWFQARLSGSDMGGTTNLRFYYLQVRDYRRGGLTLAGRVDNSTGVRLPAGEGVNGNTVFGMRFERMGDIYVPGAPGFGGLTLINSDNNKVRNNHFVRLENTQVNLSAVHGIYVAHGSDNNIVENNVFSYITGSPVRVRNGSDSNVFRGNKFDHTSTGAVGFYSEWFCDPACAEASPSSVLECGSFGNRFYENTLGPSYVGASLPLQWRDPKDLAYIGPAGCVRESQEPWVRSRGNTRAGRIERSDQDDLAGGAAGLEGGVRLGRALEREALD